MYFSTNDLNVNRNIVQDIEKKINELEGNEIMIIGDFNAHLGYLGPQKANQNGKLVNDFIENNSLVLLNCDPRCSGLITWEQRGQKSAIDFVIINELVSQRILQMTIDEEWNFLKLSDHNAISINLKVPKNEKSIYNDTHEVQFCRINEQNTEIFNRELKAANCRKLPQDSGVWTCPQ